MIEHRTIEQFRLAMRSAGLSPPEHIEPGKLHRFSTNGSRGDTAGWCRLFPDLLGGVFGDHRTQLHEIWQAERQEPFTAAELRAFQERCRQERQEREAEKAREHAEAATQAVEILKAATDDAASHPYALSKRVSFGPLVKRGRWPQRGWTNALLIPIYGVNGRVCSLQAINADGQKDYLKHARKRGGFYPFGTIRGASRVLIGEGIATVAGPVHVTKEL